MSGRSSTKEGIRRRAARWGDVYIKVFVAGVTALLLLDIPGWSYWVFLGVLALAYIRPPWDRARAPVTVSAPVTGTWLALNSPGSKVPAHGTRGYGQTYAIDVLVQNQRVVRLMVRQTTPRPQTTPRTQATLQDQATPQARLLTPAPPAPRE